MLDLRIDHGTIVTTTQTIRAGIGIKDGCIQAIDLEANLPSATHTIDAHNLIVMAGVIDPHVHMREPGHTEREDWLHGTRAAAAGGVTCVLEHPNAVPPVTDLHSLHYKRDIAASKACVDFALYGGIGFFDQPNSERTPPDFEDVMDLVQAGVCGFKTFLWPYPDRKDEFNGITTLGEEEMTTVFEMIARTGKLINVHAEHKPIVDAAMARLSFIRPRPAQFHEPSRPIQAELVAVRRAIDVAIQTGVRLNFPHCSGGSIVKYITAMRKQGHDKITAETCPQYLFVNSDRLRVVGPYGKINPPIRNEKERQMLWECLKDDQVYTIGSDHAPHEKALKEKAWGDVFEAPAGHPGLETTLPLMLTAVNQGQLTLHEVTRWCSENVARLYGLFPRKGVLQAGADADIILIDMNQRGKFDWRTMETKGKDTARLFEGMEYIGKPVMTLVRGKTVMAHGQVCGQPGDGRFVEIK